MTDTAAALRDPGPMARFEEMKRDVATMSIIAQRLMDGETLKEIAVSRQVPYGRLAEWITEDAGRAEQYARASRIWVDSLGRETVSIADKVVDRAGAAAAKVRIDARHWLASKLDRERYGESSTVKLDLPPRAPLDYDALVLETARNVGFILHSADDVLRQKPRVLLSAPATAEPTGAIPQTDEGII